MIVIAALIIAAALIPLAAVPLLCGKLAEKTWTRFTRPKDGAKGKR